MRIQIEKIEHSPENCLDVYFNDYIYGLDLQDKVTANMTAKACGQDILVSGTISAKLVLQCDRCLEDFVQDINIEISEKFVRNPIFSTEHGEFELSNAQFAEELGDIEEIDVDGLIYQLIILEIPNKKLCAENCPGIIDYQASHDEDFDKYIDERLEVFKRFSENSFNENDFYENDISNKIEIGKR